MENIIRNNCIKTNRQPLAEKTIKNYINCLKNITSGNIGSNRKNILIDRLGSGCFSVFKFTAFNFRNNCPKVLLYPSFQDIK